MICLTAILSIVTITSAIRVPTAWHLPESSRNELQVDFQSLRRHQSTKYSSIHTKTPFTYATFNFNNNNHNNHAPRRPDVIYLRQTMNKIPVASNLNLIKNNRNINNNNKYHTKNRHNNLNNSLKSLATVNNVHASFNDWIPIVGQHHTHKNESIKKEINKTQTPNFYLIRTVRNNEADQVPEDIPTKVNYPGEGKWAIRGHKHKPFHSKHKYTALKDDETKPEGYEIFEKVKPIFDMQNRKFRTQLPKNDKQIEEAKMEDDDDNFVPTQLLSQVRSTNTKEHLPVQLEDPRLREVIKDSKVHIVYTEEGYEDIGYDHAGEERHAEESAGLITQNSGRGKKLHPKKLHVDVVKEFENYEDVTADDGNDSQLSTSNQQQQRVKVVGKQSLKRVKRFVNDIPTIEIDDYLTEVSTSTNQPIREPTEKYPYYNIKNTQTLNKNSPLRYAEDLRYIPKKIEGQLSFYKHTDASSCPDIPHDVNPVPAELQQDKHSNKSEPRLKKLGEKIACLKTKYFGKNPLDSPIFSEVTIEPPEPIFPHRRKRSVDETSPLSILKRNDLEEQLPEQAPLRVRLIRRKYPGTPLRPTFPINTYLPTPSPPLSRHIATVIPKYKTLSEVYYKDEIQPNEQLNVFADVMNNIKKIRTDLDGADSALDEVTSEPDDARGEIKIKLPSRKIKIRQSSSTKYRPTTTTTTTTTTTETAYTQRSKNKFKNHKTDPQLYEEYVNTIKQNEQENKIGNKKIKDVFVESNHNDVIGLSPPIPEFTAVGVLPTKTRSNSDVTPVNTYPVTGMNPPTIHQPVLYSDFIQPPQLSRVRRKNQYHRIYKRSPHKPAYSEIRRRKPEQVADENVTDDYVPQRNRNFQYDVENQRVVYNKQDSQEEEEAEREYPEEEHLPTPKAVTQVPRRTTTTVMSGPTFLDYVFKIKGHNDYKFIMEPTEKVEESKSIESTTVSAPLSSTEMPEFLKIVNRLKSSDSYVAIPEKPLKTTTTTAVPETEEGTVVQTDEESELNQNKDFQIFDISEYLPKQDNYNPKTTIDYSKYKTIERRPIHNISSRYNVEDDNIPLSNHNDGDVVVSIETDDRRNIHTKEVTELSITSSTTEATTTKKLRLRTRRRPITTTTSKSTTSTTLSRRRFRSTTQPTTQTLEESGTQTQRVIRRKLNRLNSNPVQKIPSNHKEIYTPIPGLDGLIQTENNSNIENKSEALSSIKREKLVAPRRLSDVHVLKDYSPNKKHGGNYRRESKEVEVSTVKSAEVERLVDAVQKPFAFYSDPTLPESVNQLKKSAQLSQNNKERSENERSKDSLDEVKIIKDDNGEKVEKQSVFIVKDPSKRLYFYAPVKR